MLFTTINGVGGFGAHLGAISPGQILRQGTDFNCKGGICYGVGTANHALFQQFQQTLNQYARMGLTAYRSQLIVDGKIGDATVQAARAAAAAARLSDPGSTKEAVAANAQILNLGLQGFLGGVSTPRTPVVTSQPTGSPAPAPTSVITPQGAIITKPSAQPLPQAAAATAQIPNAAGPGLQPINPYGPPMTSPKATKEKVPLWIWIAGGTVGLLAVGGIGYALLREPSPAPSLARRYGRRR